MGCPAQEPEGFIKSQQHTQESAQMGILVNRQCSLCPVVVFIHNAVPVVCVLVGLVVCAKLMKHNLQHVQAEAVLG